MDVDIREIKSVLNVANLVHGYNKGRTQITKGKIWRYEKGNQKPFFEKQKIHRIMVNKIIHRKGNRLYAIKMTFNERLCNGQF